MPWTYRDQISIPSLVILKADPWGGVVLWMQLQFMMFWLTFVTLLLQDAAIIGKGSEPMVDNHCRSIHLCCRDSIAWNSRVFPPLHSVSGTRRHIAACTVCGWQFMISTHCSSVQFLMICPALKTGDHSPNFELWRLVLSVELIWYIQRSQLQPALLVNDSDITILFHKQQYQLSEFGFPCTWQLWQLFREKYTWVALWFEKDHLADSLSYDSSSLKW